MGTAVALLAAAIATPPFRQLDWPRVTPVQDQLPANMSGRIPGTSFPAPFSQTIWPPASPIRDQPQDQAPYNFNLYGTTAIAAPFAQLNWGPVEQPIQSPPQATPYNINIFSEVPFAQYSWPSVTPVKSGRANLSGRIPDTSFPVPFAQYSWPPAALPQDRLPDVVQPWPNFYTSVVVQVPFAQYSWPNVQPVKAALPQATPFNAWLYTNPIPFAQYSWPSVAPVDGKAPDAIQPWQNFYAVTVTAAPFAQYSWPPVTPIQGGRANLSGRIPDTSFAAPFAQYSWPPTVTIESKAADTVQPWQNFYSITGVVQAPFAQFGWPSVQPVKIAQPQAAFRFVARDVQHAAPVGQKHRPEAASQLADQDVFVAGFAVAPCHLP